LLTFYEYVITFLGMTLIRTESTEQTAKYVRTTVAMLLAILAFYLYRRVHSRYKEVTHTSEYWKMRGNSLAPFLIGLIVVDLVSYLLR
jgi:uncharacterized membrane protein YedE/YeeE